MQKLYRLLLIVLLAGIYSSCGKESEQGQIPYKYVNFSINPASIEFGSLNIPGNWAYVTGGYRGIVIYHASQDNYFAFDRACTYDWDQDCAQVKVDDDNIIARCPCCESQYLLTDGSPFDGPAIRSLRQYTTHYDGNLLHVSN
ncbi:MAG: Rieske (2Fe-2S) protein [Bacteroidota bacterium]|nr:Rieske (2Fe-2S) protein [Bacteroidota bacterium]